MGILADVGNLSVKRLNLGESNIFEYENETDSDFSPCGIDDVGSISSETD